MASEFGSETQTSEARDLPASLPDAIDQTVRGMKTLDIQSMSNEQVAPFAAETDGSVMNGPSDANSILMDLPVIMKVVLGSSKMALASVAKLTKGAVIKLDKKVGEPVDIFVNGRLIAQGEVVVLDQEANRFGVMLTQIGGSGSASRRAV
jgi:flagellar motor switch protein FliN